MSLTPDLVGQDALNLLLVITPAKARYFAVREAIECQDSTR